MATKTKTMQNSLGDACRCEIDLGGGRRGAIFSLAALEEQGAGRLARLPI
jgi:hypothetical protein